MKREVCQQYMGTGPDAPLTIDNILDIWWPSNYCINMFNIFEYPYLAHLSGDRQKSSKMAKFSTLRADGTRSSGTISSACLVYTITDALVAQRARQYDSAQIFGSILACTAAALRHKRPQRRSLSTAGVSPPVGKIAFRGRGSNPVAVRRSDHLL